MGFQNPYCIPHLFCALRWWKTATVVVKLLLSTFPIVAAEEIVFPLLQSPLAPISDKLLPLPAISKNKPTVPCFFTAFQQQSFILQSTFIPLPPYYEINILESYISPIFFFINVLIPFLDLPCNVNDVTNNLNHILVIVLQPSLIESLLKIEIFNNNSNHCQIYHLQR